MAVPGVSVVNFLRNILKNRRGAEINLKEFRKELKDNMKTLQMDTAFANRYFAQPVTRDDVVWTYSGVRPLYNDGAKSATAATRR